MIMLMFALALVGGLVALAAAVSTLIVQNRQERLDQGDIADEHE